MAEPIKSVEQITEEIAGASMPSTKGAAVLPGTDLLSNNEFKQIVKATVDGTRITVRGQQFDGAKDYKPEDIANLADRIVSPDDRTTAMQKIFNDLAAHPTSGPAQKAFVEAVTRLANDGPIKPSENQQIARPGDTMNFDIFCKNAGPLNLGQKATVQHMPDGTDVVACSSPGKAPETTRGAAK